MLQVRITGGCIATRTLVPTLFTTTGAGVPQAPARIAGPTATSAVMGARSSTHRARAPSTSSALQVTVGTAGSSGGADGVASAFCAGGRARAVGASEWLDDAGVVPLLLFSFPLLCLVCLAPFSFAFFSLVLFSFVFFFPTCLVSGFRRGSGTAASRTGVSAPVCTSEGLRFSGRRARSAPTALETDTSTTPATARLRMRVAFIDWRTPRSARRSRQI